MCVKCGLECPELTFVSRDPVVCEDSTVTLSCNATGKPTPNITWTRVTVNGTTDGVPLHPVVDGTFLISNINRSSNGSTYRCTATNGVGDPVNRTVTVTVRCKLTSFQSCFQFVSTLMIGIQLHCRYMFVKWMWSDFGRVMVTLNLKLINPFALQLFRPF